MKILVVGAGLTGSVIAREMNNKGHIVTVIDSRSAVGGNCAVEKFSNYYIHKYGPHIFHTGDEGVYKYVKKYTTITPFINTPLAYARGTLYNLPFNMHTFYRLWGTETPREAKEKLESTLVHNANPQNLEEEALATIGSDLYELFVKGYSSKFWGKPCTELPVGLIGRLPIRYTYDNNYYNATYQGILDYSRLFEILLEGIEVKLSLPFDHLMLPDYDMVVYTGKIDEYFNYSLGKLEYIPIEFRELVEEGDVQGVAVINYPDAGVEQTRTTEHKMFLNSASPKSVITKEVPHSNLGVDCYPVPTAANIELFEKYRSLTPAKVYFVGRLGSYKYLNMAPAIRLALNFARIYG